MCGVFGIFGHPEAANLTYLGLHALQHRGQESAGIVIERRRAALRAPRDGPRAGRLRRDEPRAAARARRRSGTCATRPPAARTSRTRSPSPSTTRAARSRSATTATSRTPTSSARELEAQGSIFQSSTDTEVLVHLVAMAAARADVEDRIADALAQVRARTRSSSSPRTTSHRRARSAWASARSSRHRPAQGRARRRERAVAFDLIGAEYVRDVEPGEMLVIDDGGPALDAARRADAAPTFCVFEYVYFARPDSPRRRRSVYEVRKALGRALAREHPVEARRRRSRCPTRACPRPSATRRAGIPFEMGLIRIALRRAHVHRAAADRSATSACA